MKKASSFGLIAILSFFCLTLVGCVTQEPGDQPATDHSKAVVVLHPTEGNDTHGVVTFTKVEGGVRVVATISNLEPGEHGFHIHEYGDCSSGDGTSAGGHFNPESMDHGAPDDANRHVGDLGNIEADDEGNASLDMVDAKLALNGPSSIIGRGVIVHEKADDLTSQPTGAAGGRIACGVVGVAKE